MTIKLSQVYGKEIYAEDAKKIGVVADIILDLENKKVWQLTLDPLKASILTRIPPQELLKRSVPYERVKGISDIVLVETQANPKRVL